MPYGRVHTATQRSLPAHHDSPARISPTAVARRSAIPIWRPSNSAPPTSTRRLQDNPARGHNHAVHGLTTFMDLPGGAGVSGGCFVNTTGQVTIATYNGATSLDSHSNAPIRTDGNTHPPNDNSSITAITPGPSQNVGCAPYDIYYRHLLGEGRGTPLWEPGPDMSLPTEYRRNGVSIGDVGILYRTGDFAFLFNIFLPADHEINRGRVPDRFVPLDKSRLETAIKKSVVLERGTCLASSSVRPTNSSEFAFQASGKEGALLVMPDGALTEDLRKYKLVEKYIAENAKSWYEYVESDDCGTHTENGDIRVVVGMDKVSSWGIATFKNVNSDAPLRFKFKNDGRASRVATYRWDGILAGRAWPPEAEAQDLQGPNMSPHRNQTVFVRTLNISVSGKVRDELAVHEIRASSFRDCIPDSSGHQAQPGQRNVNIQPESQVGPLPHPSNLLNKYLLEKCPNAKVVITKDSDWMSVITQNDTTPSFEDICARVLASHTICEEKGVVTLKKRKFSFNTGSTSDLSGISVAAHQQTTSEDLPNDREAYVIGRLFLEARDDRSSSDPPDTLNNTLMEKRDYQDSPSLHLLSTTDVSPRYPFNNSPTEAYCNVDLRHGPSHNAEYDVYYRHLLTRGRGTPLWPPGPSIDYAKNGGSTDDVSSPINTPFPGQFNTEYLSSMSGVGLPNDLVRPPKVEEKWNSSFGRLFLSLRSLLILDIFGRLFLSLRAVVRELTVRAGRPTWLNREVVREPKAPASRAFLRGAFSGGLQIRNPIRDYIAEPDNEYTTGRAGPAEEERRGFFAILRRTQIFNEGQDYPRDNRLRSILARSDFWPSSSSRWRGVPRWMTSLPVDVHASPFVLDRTNYRSLDRLHNFLSNFGRNPGTHDEESGYKPLAHLRRMLANDDIVRHWDMDDAANDFAFRDEHCARWLSVSSLDGSRIPPSNRGVSTIWDVRMGQSTTTTGKPYSGWAYRDLTSTPRPMDFLAGGCFDRLGDVGGSLEAWPISECENSGSELAILTGVHLSMSRYPSAKPRPASGSSLPQSPAYPI